jgi:hypothetical protein
MTPRRTILTIAPSAGAAPALAAPHKHLGPHHNGSDYPYLPPHVRVLSPAS